MQKANKGDLFMLRNLIASVVYAEMKALKKIAGNLQEEK